MKQLANRVFAKFFKDETSQLAAALAFYVAFSFAPLVIIFYWLAGTLSGDTIKIVGHELQMYLGSEAHNLFQTVVTHSKNHNLQLDSLGGLLGLFSLLLSASLIFGELKMALNKIFEIPAEETKQPLKVVVKDFIMARLRAVAMVLSFNLLIIFSFIASSTIFGAINVENKGVILFLTALFSWFFYIFAFTLMLRFVPARKLNWKPAFRGGLLIAFFFLIGKELIGVYMGKTAVGTDFGAAGSAIVLLVWIYYSAMVIFLGAELTYLLNSDPSRQLPA